MSHADPAPPAAPSTSLIIPSRGRPDLLLATIRSILDGEQVPTEIIIIDQSVEPNAVLAELTTDRPCAIRYQWTPIAGVSRARNAGIATASYDILAFTDDDVLVTPSWFGALVSALLRGGPRSVISGRVLAGRAQSPDGFAPSTREDLEPVTYVGRIGNGVLYPNNMALFRSAIAEVGLFDERLGAGSAFPSAEDNDLGFRLLEAGYQIRYTPGAVLYHVAWRTKRDVLPLNWSYAFGQGAFYAKHMGMRDSYMLRRLSQSLRGHARGLVRAAIHERRFSSADAVYIAGLLAGSAKWLITNGKPTNRAG